MKSEAYHTTPDPAIPRVAEINRYHNPGTGRLLTPDPYQATASGASIPASPGSWNRYAYAIGDPIAYYDPAGKFAVTGGSCYDASNECSDDDDGLGEAYYRRFLSCGRAMAVQIFCKLWRPSQYRKQTLQLSLYLGRTRGVRSAMLTWRR